MEDPASRGCNQGKACPSRLLSDMVTWVNDKSFLFFDFVAEDFYF
jgi:hypothetical protein